MTVKLGILAYGSLMADPGTEIQQATDSIIKNTKTPFSVEFARKSRTREDAPTLVPHRDPGRQVQAWIFVMKEGISEQDASNRLYRREIHQVGNLTRVYRARQNPGPNDVTVDRVRGLGQVDVVLYTSLQSNIQDLNAGELAKLAVRSAALLFTRDKSSTDDGISYLISAKDHGIETDLSGPYEEEIKRLTQARDLKDALAKVRANPKAFL